MPLEPGQVLGRYRIQRKIGEGGMGEVWAATDTRLDRPAAIKALPAAVAADAERLARFKREAQLLAALSHPNIAAIYGLEQVGDASYLAMELVEGDEIAARIDGRAVPCDEAVEIALQIADALEEAHDKGIVHRDLKPANIKLTADGRVKVLDFGLAKALTGETDDGSVSPELSRSPTLTAAMGTQAGVILGTAAYMSPEQARGKPVDRRADIWAFGVILFEMLTGRRLYTGETATDVIAHVVTREPDWEQLPPDTPPAVRRVLRRCLQKDPRKRLRDIGDAALELREEHEEVPAAERPTAPTAVSSRRPWFIGAAGLALGLLVATAITIKLRPAAGDVPLTWSTLSAPAGVEYLFKSFLELSPDGRRVAFVASPAEGGDSLLWVRELGQERARPLAGTEGAYQPFWSPDSRSIGYFARRKLRRIGIEGGVATALATVGSAPRGGCWGDNGTIIYVPGWNQPLFRVNEAGGPAEAITKLSEERLELSHRWPHLLPDGNHFLFYAVSTYPELNPANPSKVDQSGLYIGSLDGAEPRLLQTARSRAVYRAGSLLYVDDGILTVRPFDAASLSFRGDPVALVEGVTQSVDALWGGALFSVSEVGSLMFVRGAPEHRALGQMQWFDRNGNAVGTLGGVDSYNGFQISHRGSRVVASSGDPGDLRIYDLERNTGTRFTFDPGMDDSPVWSPDDARVLFQSSRLIPGQPFSPSSLFQKPASGQGAEEHLAVVDTTRLLAPTDWSPDGKTAVLTSHRQETGADIVLYSFETGEVEVYLQSEHDEDSATFSPDGRWVAYRSDETGRSEIYVAAYPGPGGKWQLSSDGGSLPVWRADGRELFYLGSDRLMAVTVETGRAFRHDTPVPLFELPEIIRADWTWQTLDVTPDGRRFLLLVQRDDQGAGERTLTLVQGWRALID